MALLYFDKQLQEYETSKDFIPAIEYLIKKFSTQRNIQILNSLVANSWFYFIEGPFLKKEIRDDEMEYLLYQWKKYDALGVSQYSDAAEFCYIGGYTTYLHGYHIDIFDNEEKGLQMVQRCLDICKDEKISALARYFITQEKPNDLVTIINELFPSESLLDEYFRETLQPKYTP